MSPDDAIASGRRIAGLIGHSPGPGIYSRMQRAVEAMPEMVRAEELPGLIRRHKEGVPGWELKAVGLPSLYEGRSAVPREELLQAVKDRSPLYTHGEVVLRGGPGDYPKSQADIEFPEFAGLFGPEPFASRIGQGLPSGKTEYGTYAMGGDDYTEILLTQPGARHRVYGNHWDVADAVAHARFDRHGDALRINELQSDLGIHNRKMREVGRQQKVANFPLEDAWLDILIKRLALEAARGGYRAIEIASPRSIADMVGGNIDNYEHLYGKVIPGRLERLGRKMGGLYPQKTPAVVDGGYETAIAEAATREKRIEEEIAREIARLTNAGDYGDVELDYEANIAELSDILKGAADYSPTPSAISLYEKIVNDAVNRGVAVEDAYREASQAMPRIMTQLGDLGVASNANWALSQADRYRPADGGGPAFRYLMSDEMRRNILRNGIPASVLGAAALSEER